MKQHWFRKSGWFVRPSSWQGGAVVLAVGLAQVASLLWLKPRFEDGTVGALVFFVVSVGLALGLMAVVGWKSDVKALRERGRRGD